ncbi:guanitoxin biosynthesis heme-dependent pre-guanitoxin N-hydroxylase GntA [Roseateles sp. DC23W]|uniref:Guanitoxin biosynthesis heme-dependent pre-guanitoxin N-hydroxylase GntA n=1 Tax=Pelomonas dachongensis TaxID=3299029 RepID=A0ABW7EFN1_9BURK
MQYQDNHAHAQRHERLAAEFNTYISDRAFPCVGAKSASNRGRMDLIVCDELGTEASAQRLCCSLAQFSARYPEPGEDPVSFVAIFEACVGEEDEFHQKLWRQLQLIHDLDATRHAWATGVSDDPASNDFSFSVAGRAFFVVGLHPNSSRLARRAPRPTLVFNFHEQFEAMRASGRYAKLQTAIRQRDVELQGNINPVLAQFGQASEAQQYSGKHGGGCPFQVRKAAA